MASRRLGCKTFEEDRTSSFPFKFFLRSSFLLYRGHQRIVEEVSHRHSSRFKVKSIAISGVRKDSTGTLSPSNAKSGAVNIRPSFRLRTAILYTTFLLEPFQVRVFPLFSLLSFEGSLVLVKTKCVLGGRQRGREDWRSDHEKRFFHSSSSGRTWRF